MVLGEHTAKPRSVAATGGHVIHHQDGTTRNVQGSSNVTIATRTKASLAQPPAFFSEVLHGVGIGTALCVESGAPAGGLKQGEKRPLGAAPNMLTLSDSRPTSRRSLGYNGCQASRRHNYASNEAPSGVGPRIGSLSIREPSLTGDGLSCREP